MLTPQEAAALTAVLSRLLAANERTTITPSTTPETPAKVQARQARLMRYCDGTMNAVQTH
jgi:hypothetical protein